MTSPSLTSRTERIRVDGSAISEQTYIRLAAQLAHATDRMRAAHPDWVVPHLGGMHLLAAARHFQDIGVDVAVFEASRGGRRDEVSLLNPSLFTLTPVFGEHLGIIGNTVEEIAEEKLGAIGSRTQMLVSVPQADCVERQIGLALHANPGMRRLLPPAADANLVARFGALTAANVSAGTTAGKALARSMGRRAAAGRLSFVLSSLRLPGRTSVHPGPAGPVLVDCAVNGSGVGQALSAAISHFGQPSTVLVYLPSNKDVAGALKALAGQHVVAVDNDHVSDYLRLDPADFPGCRVVPMARLRLEDFPGPVLAVGTVSFIGHVLRLLGVSDSSAYRLP